MQIPNENNKLCVRLVLLVLEHPSSRMTSPDQQTIVSVPIRPK